MLSARVIPCLDVDDGRVVKGIKFKQLRDAGDPVVVAQAYEEQGADELVFLDITASSDERNTMRSVVEKTAATCFMPLTVGGGIRNVDNIRNMLLSGADKVSLNTAAILNPTLINEASTMFGNQCIVVAIDAKKNSDRAPTLAVRILFGVNSYNNALISKHSGSFIDKGRVEYCRGV